MLGYLRLEIVLVAKKSLRMIDCKSKLSEGRTGEQNY